MRLSRFFIVVLCLVAVSGFVYAFDEADVRTTKGLVGGADARTTQGLVVDDEASQKPLTKLLDGNKRFASGELAKKDIGDQRRQELTKGQHPFAMVLSCADSRVPAEIVFDQGLGDIFVVRVAGNVVEPTTLGSIEYGAEHLNAPLLVILGHSQCGAVKATLEAKGKPEGDIGAILKKIMPAVATAKKATKNKDEVLNVAISENVKNTYKEVMKSKIVSHLVHEGKLKVVGAIYSLNTGKVEMVEISASTQDHKHHH